MKKKKKGTNILYLSIVSNLEALKFRNDDIKSNVINHMTKNNIY